MKRSISGTGGRGIHENPPNRFERLHVEPLPPGEGDASENTDTRFFRDASRTILTRNESPDLLFRYSLNPYRGCEHGCAYCYARPSHEYLSFSSGLDFETRILVKPDEVDDLSAMRLARDIVKKIEESLEYPGQIRVIVLRETRAIDYAK